MIPHTSTITSDEFLALKKVFYGGGPGMLLGFNKRTFTEFFRDKLNVDIDEPRFCVSGTSEQKRFGFYLLSSSPVVAAKTIEVFWEFRYNNLERFGEDEPYPESIQEITQLVDRLNRVAGKANTYGIDAFYDNRTLHELVAALERDVESGNAAVPLDRLHTYCMKKFAHLLALRGEGVCSEDTLNGRAGRYFNPMRRSENIRPVTDKIMQSTVQIFEQFNSVRNDHSLAHDNELLGRSEARYIFDAVVNLLRFVKAVEGERFE